MCCLLGKGRRAAWSKMYCTCRGRAGVEKAVIVNEAQHTWPYVEARANLHMLPADDKQTGVRVGIRHASLSTSF